MVLCNECQKIRILRLNGKKDKITIHRSAKANKILELEDESKQNVNALSLIVTGVKLKKFRVNSE